MTSAVKPGSIATVRDKSRWVRTACARFDLLTFSFLRSADDEDEEINVVDVSDDEKPSSSSRADGDLISQTNGQSVSVIRHVHIDPTHKSVISANYPSDLDGLARSHRASLPSNWSSSRACSAAAEDSGDSALDLRVKSNDRTPLRRNKSFNSAGAKRTATTDVFTDQSSMALNKSCDADTLRRLGIKRAPVVYNPIQFPMGADKVLNFSAAICPTPIPSQHDLLMQSILSSSATNLEFLRLYRSAEAPSPIPKSLQPQQERVPVPIDSGRSQFVLYKIGTTDSLVLGNEAEAYLDVDEHFKKSLSQKRKDSANADGEILLGFLNFNAYVWLMGL